MAKKIAKTFNLLSHKIYTEYRNYDKIPEKHRLGDREELRKVIGTICKHIGNEIVERKAGVHIRRLGYFFVWKMPKKLPYIKQVKGGKAQEIYNYHTDQYMYSPILLVSLDHRRSLNNWSMDNSFARKIKLGIRDKVTEGFKYKIYPYSIRRLNNM
jgi:hypothetical protein